MCEASWMELRAEYITTDASYRELSSKYGISTKQIFNRSKAEGWREQREQYRNSVSEEILQSAKKDVLDRRARLLESVDKLMARVDALLDLEEGMAPRDLKSLSSLLMDVKMITGIRDEESEKAAADENAITVTFVGNDWEADSDADA